MARRLSRDDIISNVYYNFETGFGSINGNLKKTKEQDLSIIRVDVENFMRKQDWKIQGFKLLHRSIRKV